MIAWRTQQAGVSLQVPGPRTAHLTAVQHTAVRTGPVSIHRPASGQQLAVRQLTEV